MQDVVAINLDISVDSTSNQIQTDCTPKPAIRQTGSTRTNTKVSAANPIQNVRDFNIILTFLAIDLKDMKFENINRTFAKHEVALSEIFRNHRKLGHDFRYVPSESQFPIILDELLLERQKVEMYLKIRAELNPDSADNITSNVR